MITREYEMGDLLVTVSSENDSFNILKIEKYCYETSEYLDISMVKSEKLTNYIYEKLNEKRIDESINDTYDSDPWVFGVGLYGRP